MPVSAKSGAPWTDDEDALLAQYQAVYGNKWSQVSQHIPGRNGQQCAQRWRHKVNPNIVRDKWTAEEDSVLVKLVGELGVGKWATVARHLPGRTDQQCMGRWRRHLDPQISKDAWSPAEDAKLQSLHEQLGCCWSQIAKVMGNRTPQQCRGRWCIMTGGGHNKAKAASSPVGPRTPHPTRSSRRGVGATAVAAAAAARQACPSTVTRRGAVAAAPTEVPDMPAAGQATEAAQPPTVQQARRTRTRSGPRPSAAATLELPPPTAVRPDRPRRVVGRRAASSLQQLEEEDEDEEEPREGAEEEGQDSDREAESAEEDAEPAEEAGDEAAAGPSSCIRRGRVLLGLRVVTFRTRPRSTRTRPRGRVTAIRPVPSTSASPPPPPVPAARAGCRTRAARARLSAAAAAVALLSPPRTSLSLCLSQDMDEAVMLQGLLEDDDGEQAAALEPARAPCAEGAAAGCDTPRSADVSAPFAGDAAEQEARAEPEADEAQEQGGEGTGPQLRRSMRCRANTRSGASGGTGSSGRSAGRSGSGSGRQGRSGAGGSTVDSEAGCGGSRQSAGRTVDAPSEEVHSHATGSPRKTRSGRCYFALTASAAATSTGTPRRRRQRTPPASQSAGQDPNGAGSSEAAPATSTAADGDANAAGPSGQHAGSAAAVPGPSRRASRAGEAARADEAAVPRPMLSDDDESSSESVEAGPAATPPGGAAAAAGPAQPEMASPPLQLQIPQEQVLDALLPGSGRSSFGLPDAAAGHASPAPGDQPLDWQQVVGSPPTSSLLALLHAGLLNTPTGTPGPSPGPAALRAPVPAGMPQVTPGCSNGWSDVPPLSWSEWRKVNGGFGVMTAKALEQAPGAGTPDNTRVASRTAGVQGATTHAAEETPRRDMFVRHLSLTAAGTSTAAASVAMLEGRGHIEQDDGEGHGEGTGRLSSGARSVLVSPSGSVHSQSRPRRSATRRASADEVILERDVHMRLAGVSTGPGGVCEGVAPRPFSALASAMLVGCSPRHGHHASADAAALPDFCSPSKRLRMAASEPGAAAAACGASTAAPLSAVGASNDAGPSAPVAVPSRAAVGSRLGAGAFGLSTSAGAARPPATLLDNLPPNLRSWRDPAPQSSLMSRLQQLESACPTVKAEPGASLPALPPLPAMTTSSTLSPAAPLMAGAMPVQLMAMPPAAALPQPRPLPVPPAPQIPIPPALARALMPPPSSRARQLSTQGLAPLPPPPPLPALPFSVLAPAPGGGGGQDTGMGEASSAGVAPLSFGTISTQGQMVTRGHMTLPTLALPKPPGGPQQRPMTSLFPVLTISSFNAGKENSESFH
ncbi:hypothetical protein HYH03_003180 [Edaphochlamys debaryana]|uniref:Uncharacterized protein n=1 Tax=Edaphochlamys debaryana TaxID=47281 RepID=A0A835YJU5_9CHLO|nr:hypothetical protein HYH03_003180 [Edaphochlamys debaryana]|eukprot:KAG2498994.1 hypothetical protein HYH03_003180 [Edaphochlamys debaryana]